MRVTERLQDDLRVSHQCLAEAQRHSSLLIAALAPKPDVKQQYVEKVEQAIGPLPVAQKDEVSIAIELAARDNTALARYLDRWSKEQKMNGVDETAIANAIMHWPSGTYE